MLEYSRSSFSFSLSSSQTGHQTDSRRFHPTTVRFPPPLPLPPPDPIIPLRIFIALPRSPRRCGVDVVKLPWGHRPLSPGPVATGHGHCPPVYSPGEERREGKGKGGNQSARLREKTSPALYGSICTHGKMVSLYIPSIRTMISIRSLVIIENDSCNNCHIVVYLNLRRHEENTFKLLFIISINCELLLLEFNVILSR